MATQIEEKTFWGSDVFKAGLGRRSVRQLVEGTNWSGVAEHFWRHNKIKKTVLGRTHFRESTVHVGKAL